MNLFRSMGILLTLGGMVCAGLTAAKATTTPPPYSSYTILDRPHKTNIIATGINSSGQIVGGYTDSHSVQHGFLLYQGTYTKIDVPTAFPGSTAPAAINEPGVIVGTYVDNATYGNRGFTYNHGVYSTFAVNLPNAVPNTTFAAGINDWGQIVGDYLDYNGYTRGYVLYNGVYTSFDVHSPDTNVTVNATIPGGINDLGQISGQYVTEHIDDPTISDTHGFILSGSHLTTLDVPGAINGTNGAGTQAAGINIFGQVVGSFVDATGFHGFLYSCGTYTVLNAPNAANTYAFNINNLGQIVGYFDDGNYDGSNFHGFVLNP